jgi:NTP pyrophosphatase (non-canonical NTP hydrolase)
MKPTRKAAGKASLHPLVRPVWMDWINRRVAKNLDKWGVQDFETLGLAVAEEAGELAQAILQARDEGGERGRISHEAIDLAALCVQVLVTMVEKHGAENVYNALFKDGANTAGEGRGTPRTSPPPCSVSESEGGKQ